MWVVSLWGFPFEECMRGWVVGHRSCSVKMGKSVFPLHSIAVGSRVFAARGVGLWFSPRLELDPWTRKERGFSCVVGGLFLISWIFLVKLVVWIGGKFVLHWWLWTSWKEAKRKKQCIWSDWKIYANKFVGFENFREKHSKWFPTRWLEEKHNTCLK